MTPHAVYCVSNTVSDSSRLPDTYFKDYPEFDSEAHRELALKAAEESEILLKNTDGILPLAQGIRILVAGPNANTMRCLNGGWSYSWQGHIADMFAGEYNTIYEVLSEKFGKGNFTLCQGVTYKEDGAYHEENAPEIDKAVAAAAGADVMVACIGENSKTVTFSLKGSDLASAGIPTPSTAYAALRDSAGGCVLIFRMAPNLTRPVNVIKA